MKGLIHSVLMEALNEKQYSSEQCKAWTEQISNSIKTKLKGVYGVSHKLIKYILGRQRTKYDMLLFFAYTELNLERYKFVVQVVIGEQRGEGVK